MLLELLRQAHIDEAPRGVVGEAWITDRVSTLAGGEGRIFVEDVIAADRKYSALQEMVPDAQLAWSGSGNSGLVVFRIGRYRRFCNKGAEIVGGLKIEQPPVPHVMVVQIGILLMEAVDITNGPD